MKTITQEEMDKMVHRTMKRQGHIRTRLQNLKVGELLFLEPQDWTWKTAAPSSLCRRIEKATDLRFECVKVIEPQSGWVIKRIA